jgi:hypothetical protein
LRGGAIEDVLIHVFSVAVGDPDGHSYRARAMGRQRRDGTWIGWLEFTPSGSGGIVRRTDRETTQPSEGAVRYWALGLELAYLEGALERAVRGSPPLMDTEKP